MTVHVNRAKALARVSHMADDALISAEAVADGQLTVPLPVSETFDGFYRRELRSLATLAAAGARRQQPVMPSPEPSPFWAEVRRLPHRQAQVIALAYVYDMGVADIATTLGVSDGTVKTHLARGRTALAQLLIDPRLEEQDS